MNKSQSSEMISTKFYVGWLYVFEINRFLNKLIKEYGMSFSYEHKIGLFQNEFIIHGNQKEVYSVCAHIEQWFASF